MQALRQELALRQDYLQGEPVETIYFGGGTPSLLSPAEVRLLLGDIARTFSVKAEAEVTLEANPDDLPLQRLQEYREAGVNRLSIGIQAFQEHHLRLMNRSHSAHQAVQVLENVEKAGFSNITIDLIYGIPGLTDAEWAQNLHFVQQFNVPHFSAYGLTVEEKTRLHHQVKTGQLAAPDDAMIERQFMMMRGFAQEHEYVHYEVSNFGRQGWLSRHNTSYWLGEKYLGIGPSAHSFDGQNRQWNLANNPLYLKALKENVRWWEEEELTELDQLNELLMTGLRTMWGCNLATLEASFGPERRQQVMREAQPYLKKGWLELVEDVLQVTPAGRLFTDRITSDLFFIEE